MAALPVNLGYNVAVWHHIGDQRVQLARGDAVLGAASNSVGVSEAMEIAGRSTLTSTYLVIVRPGPLNDTAILFVLTPTILATPPPDCKFVVHVRLFVPDGCCDAAFILTKRVTNNNVRVRLCDGFIKPQNHRRHKVLVRRHKASANEEAVPQLHGVNPGAWVCV